MQVDEIFLKLFDPNKSICPLFRGVLSIVGHIILQPTYIEE